MKKLLILGILASFQAAYTAENKLDLDLLHYAVDNALLQEALADGACIDYVADNSRHYSTYYDGYTPIYLAVNSFVLNCSDSRLEKVKMLLDKGVPNTINHACYNSEKSPLAKAIFDYCLMISEQRKPLFQALIIELIRHGADINEDSCQQVLTEIETRIETTPDDQRNRAQDRIAEVHDMYDEYRPRTSWLKMEFVD